MKIVDGDSHLIEPLDMFTHYIEPAYRERAMRAVADPTMGGEDFSLYLLEKPGCFFWLGSGPEQGAEDAYGLHHPRYTLNEDCIPIGSALLADIALKRLA